SECKMPTTAFASYCWSITKESFRGSAIRTWFEAQLIKREMPTAERMHLTFIPSVSLFVRCSNVASVLARVRLVYHLRKVILLELPDCLPSELQKRSTFT